MEFKITEQEKGQRLDRFLLGSMPAGLSRAFLQKLIKNGGVLVDSKIKKQSYSLKEGEIISIVVPEQEKFILAPDKKIKFKVLYEDENIIAVNKPAGISVHPTEGVAGEKTLVAGLLAKYPDIAGVGEHKLRPGIVHRLDKDTSGVMIVARNQKTFDFLKEQFKERKVIKKYIALVAGDIKKESGIIAFSIARRRSIPTKQVAVKDAKQAYAGRQARGKIREAVTEYQVARRLDIDGKKFTLVEVMPKTGRMHQIRVHFAALGHPLAGDLKYGSRNNVAIAGLDRQFLHSESLEIEIFGKKHKFLAPLPKDLKKLIKKP